MTRKRLLFQYNLIIIHRSFELTTPHFCGLSKETTMTPVKTFRLMSLGDAKRATKGIPPTGVEPFNQPGLAPVL
jgi:hypothetical protein